MRNFHESVELLNLVQGIDTRGETTVKAENASLNDGSKWKVVEKGGEVLPNVGISIFSKALIVETVHLGDLFGLVVTSEKSDSRRKSDLHGDEERNGLN